MHINDMFKNECVGKSEHGALKYYFASRQIMPIANMRLKERTSYTRNGTLQQLELYLITLPEMYFDHFGQHLTSSYFS
jgi:hypothetical protein